MTDKLIKNMSIRRAGRLHICQQPHPDSSIGGNSAERINQFWVAEVEEGGINGTVRILQLEENAAERVVTRRK